MDKSVVVALVDSVILVLVYVLGKYVTAPWVDAVKNILFYLQPLVVAFIVKLLGLEITARLLQALR